MKTSPVQKIFLNQIQNLIYTQREISIIMIAITSNYVLYTLNFKTTLTLYINFTNNQYYKFSNLVIITNLSLLDSEIIILFANEQNEFDSLYLLNFLELLLIANDGINSTFCSPNWHTMSLHRWHKNNLMGNNIDVKCVLLRIIKTTPCCFCVEIKQL